MSGPRLPGSVLQRLAERICSPDACRRLLLPIVADLQFEWQRASSATRRLGVRLRGTTAFAGALAFSLVRLTPDERDASRRLLVRTALATLAVGAALFADSVRWPIRRGLPDAAVLLLPSILAVALPIGCLLGVLLAGRTRARPLLAIASLAGLATVGVAGWLTPRANQAYRERVLAAVAPEAGPPERGDREWTLTELGARVEELRLRGEAEDARRLAVEWHKKPALAAMCLALALAGAALARLVSRPWARIALGLAVINAAYLSFRLGEQAGDLGWLAPAPAVWGSVVAVFALALGLALPKREGRGSPLVTSPD